MLFIGAHYWRIFAAPLITLALCDPAACQAQPKASPPGARVAPASAKAAVASMWQTIMTTCPIKGSASPATFLPSSRELYEYRDASTELFSWDLTEADRLNGTTFKGVTILRASAYRSIESGGSRQGEHRQWSAFRAPNSATRNMQGAAWFGSEDIYRIHDGFSAWWPSIWVALVEQRNGNWSWSKAGFDAVHPRPDSLAMVKGSCEALTTADPFAAEETAREAASAKVAAASALASAKAAAALASAKAASAKAAVAKALASARVNARDGLTYVFVSPGEFTMGCSPGDSRCGPDEAPAHEVTITKGFWLGQTEVTQEAYQKVTGNNPSSFKGAKLPVDQISWNNAQSFCQAASMRLPTEAEWEYAARAGSQESLYGDLGQIAWFAENSGARPHEVGQKQPNSWGLYDMLGNVWEWVADLYVPRYSAGNQTDPQGPASGSPFRVLRGAIDWGQKLDPTNARISNGRVSYRARNLPDSRYNNIGVRCAGEVP